MSSLFKTVLAVSALAALAGCNRSVPADESANDQPAVNQAMPNQVAMADASNPYAQSEMKMHEAMAAAVGTDVSDTWVAKMIEHHRGAVAMSNVVLAANPSTELRDIAQRTINKQSNEIKQFEAMRKKGNPSPASANVYRTVEMKMHDGMMAAKGGDPSALYIAKMIAHHQGAVDMSDIAVAKAEDPQVRAMASKVAADQRKDIAELKSLLGG